MHLFQIYIIFALYIILYISYIYILQKSLYDASMTIFIFFK